MGMFKTCKPEKVEPTKLQLEAKRYKEEAKQATQILLEAFEKKTKGQVA